MEEIKNISPTICSHVEIISAAASSAGETRKKSLENFFPSRRNFSFSFGCGKFIFSHQFKFKENEGRKFFSIVLWCMVLYSYRVKCLILCFFPYSHHHRLSAEWKVWKVKNACIKIVFHNNYVFWCAMNSWRRHDMDGKTKSKVLHGTSFLDNEN